MRIAMTRVEVSYRIQQEDWIEGHTATIIKEVSYRIAGKGWVAMRIATTRVEVSYEK